MATRKKRKPEVPAEPPRGPICPVVGMGASAGGLEAFQKFFSAMPPDSGLSFVLVQHLDPRHPTVMPELLSKVTAMPVEQVRDETPAEANHVYVIPPNAVLTIEGGILRVKPPEAPGVRMPIDRLFHSLAEDQGSKAVCILFSGSGSDGTLGLRAVKAQGGLAMAQTPESAKHDNIVRSAIATGMVDHVLPPEAMPAKLMEYAAYLRDLHARRDADFAAEAGDHLARICALLRRKTGHDFTRYKTATLVRRIQRRMQVVQLQQVADYVEMLRHQPKEVELLFRDLLIGVTHFFRDPEAFEVLAREAIPNIMKSAGPDGVIRVWTPGCATGEEAYSIAMLLREEMTRQDARPRVQIFAGDIDDEALEWARQGRYPQGITEHVTPERLERFFSLQTDFLLVSKEIREMCIFSTHNLIRDPPFSRLDLVVCRNLLIYLEADLQRHVSTIFHYALRPGGFLFLGPSESIAGPPDLFRTVDKKHRLFQRTETVTRPPLALPLPGRFPPARRPPAPSWTLRVPAPGQQDHVARLERLLLDEYAPAWVIVNAQGEIIYFSPRTGRFLEPASGAPTMDILSMARKGLRLDLRTALHKTIKTSEPILHENVAVETGGDVQRINLLVRPLVEMGDDPGLFMIVFQELGPPVSKQAAASVVPARPESEHIVQQLESELRMTKEHLQATVEEVETSNEELKSSNEELLSTNEELQSANEELQTSKEEMQSVNEELETINAELNQKIEQLDRANSDLQNLLQSIQIPTVFLDNQLRIKRFTEAATTIFRLIETDVGRPITDIANRFEGDLVADMREVLRNLSSRERQVQLADHSAIYLVRTLPYRRTDNVIDGVVITFLDVTTLERAQEERAQLAAIVKSSHDAIIGRTLAGAISAWNQSATHMFGYAETEAMGRPLSLIVPPDRQAALGEAYDRLKHGEVVPPFESVLLTKEGRRLDVSIVISPVQDQSGDLVGASAIVRDVSELKHAEEALRTEVRHKDEFLALLSHELRNPLAPIRSGLDVLHLSDVPREQREASLRIMDRQVTHLTSLVDQLMDGSRIASGKIQLDLQDEDLVELVRTTIEDQRRVVEAQRLTLDLRLPNRQYWVHGDRLRLAQVVSNLVGNAVKFTEPGGRVTVSLTAEDGNLAVLTVRDTGIGIEGRALRHVFLPFNQAENRSPRSRGGLGLGLALVRTLIQAHGGTVEARSEGLGQGSEFTIRLPLRQDRVQRRVPSTDARSAGSLAARRVLIVEDNLDAAEGLKTLLELMGHAVALAHDGPTGIERALSGHPDIVLCDIGLPGMSGHEVAAALRAQMKNGHPLLVALTGFDQPRDQVLTRQSGFDVHLTKPVDVATLRRLLEALPQPT